MLLVKRDAKPNLSLPKIQTKNVSNRLLDCETFKYYYKPDWFIQSYGLLNVPNYQPQQPFRYHWFHHWSQD